MDAIKELKFLKWIILPSCLLAQNAWAYSKGSFKFLLNYYSQSGDQGYQVYDNSNDEKVDVIEPMIFAAYQIDENTQMNANLVFDSWSAASDTKLDGNTGASGPGGISQQARVAGNIGMSVDHQSWKWSSRLGVSNEFDYQSLNVGGSIQKNFADDNFVLALSPQFFMDNAKYFDLVAQKPSDFIGRKIYSLDVSGSQIMSPTSLWQFGVTGIMMKGMLNNISNSVIVATNPYNNDESRVEEKLPDNRFRTAFYTRWIQALSESSGLHLFYRYYTDDWDVKAHTAELGFRWLFNEDKTFILPNIRYYSQSKSQHWQKEFLTLQEFMTSDSDIAEFDSFRYGFNISHENEGKLFGYELSSLSWTGGVYLYSRSNGLDYFLGQLGVGIEF